MPDLSKVLHDELDLKKQRMIKLGWTVFVLCAIAELGTAEKGIKMFL